MSRGVARTLGRTDRFTNVERKDADYDGTVVSLQFAVNATDLSAGTTQELISPVDGVLTKMRTTIQVAIVTGGVVSVAVAGGSDVASLSQTIADSAAAGARQTTTASVSVAVAKGDRIQVKSTSAFNGGGAINGVLEITPTRA